MYATVNFKPRGRQSFWVFSFSTLWMIPTRTLSLNYDVIIANVFDCRRATAFCYACAERLRSWFSPTPFNSSPGQSYPGESYVLLHRLEILKRARVRVLGLRNHNLGRFDCCRWLAVLQS